MSYRIITQHRRGTSKEWLLSTVVPKEGELVIEECVDGSRKCKIGDGKNRFTDLLYIDSATKKEILKELETNISDLKKQDENNSNQLISVNNTLRALIDSVSTELASTKVDTKNTCDRLAKALDDAEKALRGNDADILSTVLANITKIYNELTDLVDDDILIIEKVFAVENTLTAKIAGQQSDLKTKLNAVNATLEQLSDRISANKISNEDLAIRLETYKNIITEIHALPEGSTKEDGELANIRSGYDGLVYETAGDAVRQIGYDLNELKASLPDYIPANAVDGLLYENNMLYLTSDGEPVGDPVEITGGTGGSAGSVVRVTNNLPSTSIVKSVGNDVYIDFTYTSFENEVATGDGYASIAVNGTIVSVLSCGVMHGVAKRINVTDYLKVGANTVKVTCSDQYGVSRSLAYNISLIELKVSSTFNSAQIFDKENPVLFRYTVTGQIDKDIHILVDGDEQFTATISSSASGKTSTLTINNLTHGCHKLQAYATAVIDGEEFPSNILEFDILWKEADNQAAMIASVYDVTSVTQGDLVSIPFMIYDPAKVECTVDLIVQSQVAGELIEVDRASLVVGRGQQFWNTRKYPAGKNIFTISYSYSLYGVAHTITKSHSIDVAALDIDISADEDSLQLYLSAQGRLNTEQNPATWTYTPKADGVNTVNEVTTTFTDFNWKSNGWLTDANGDTCLRLNGDARATINFKPFAEDFKKLGKTIEFEFAVRDVNSRDAVVIDCYGADGKGFRATPDTAFLQSGGNNVSCRYKDEERVRVAVTVESSDTLSRFISIYLDGVLSGVKRYVDTDGFSQLSPVNIVLGSNLCGLDVYSIRIYNKALSAAQILDNYIADQADPNTKLKLFTDNDILGDNEAISYERVKALGQIPIVTFTGQMPTYKGDKKKKSVRMKFEDPEHPELNFDVLLDQIDVQGTSSQFYVRKNWKVKLPEKKQHMPNAIPTKTFCIKVDYAEATGTHNTGTANYVETLYNKDTVMLPPQKDDSRIRTTIQGFPCVIFEKATEDSEPVFSSKANFNYDKGSEEAFGFTDTYEGYGVECWEFCNNTSPSCNFTGSIVPDWSADFEPRYVPESANFERIEALLEKKTNAANGKDTFSESEAAELLRLQTACITNFKQVHDWVLSTATYELTFDDDGNITGRKPITEKPLSAPVTYGDTTYSVDNEAYRLAKFKYEFEDYFNMHYCSIYYVFTFFALMTDQRAKNMFLTRWKESDGVYRWYPYFYDNDTIFGINNEGALVFDYYHEDTDQLGSSNVYNGQNSILWNNFRRCFAANILSTYSELRSSGKLTYDKIIDQYITNHSDEWSAAVYNADAEYKYVSMAREIQTEGEYAGTVDDSNLYQVRGPGEHHLRYFIANRLNYCDSKWYAGKYPDDYIFLRIYTPTLTEITDDMSDTRKAEVEALNARISKSLEAVPANPNITVTPFSNMYAGVKYKANGVMQQQRLARGESYTFGPPTPETFNDTETGIYGASELSSLGDLSGLYCGVISLGKASKLTDITIGNPNPDYHNDNFREIRVGSNRLLKSIDLRNCSGLGLASGVSIDSGWGNAAAGSAQTTLDLSGCPNIETIYAEGTNLQTIALPESGYIKTLHMPASTTILNIKNHRNIEDFQIESYAKLRTLCVENCPTLDTNAILNACKDATGKYTVERVRLTGLSWTLPDASFIKTLYPKYDEDGSFIGGIRGIDENNHDLDEAYLVGTCHINELTGAEYTEIKSHYPFLNITFGKMTSNVTFKYTDDAGIEHEEVRSIAGENSEFGEITTFEPEYIPAWPENDAFTYELYGWSRLQQVSKGLDDSENDYLSYVQADAMTNIAGDRTLYPIFKAIRKKYRVTFVNPTADGTGKVLAIVETPYNDTAKYPGSYPGKLDVSTPSLYEFVGWSPSPENVTGHRTCYAQFAIVDNMWYTLGLLDISDCADSNGNIYDGYALDKNAKTMSITACKNKSNAAVKIPTTFSVDGVSYTVVSVKGFSGNNTLELIKLPESVISILAKAFSYCSKLSEITLHEGLTSIGSDAFYDCGLLTELHIPASVTSIGDAAFSKCTNLKDITIAEGNPTYKMVANCLVNVKTGALLLGLSNGAIPQDGTIKELRPYCFNGSKITNVSVPSGITNIPSNAFSSCAQLTTVELPETITSLDATCFAWCYALSSIVLPESLVNIKTYVFTGCPMEEVNIPASVDNILDHAFGGQKNLKTVTFKKKLDKNGNIVAPHIDKAAFADSGHSVDGVVFNVPWAEDYDYNYEISVPNGDGTSHTEKIDPTGWGATKFTINYNYEEVD